ncbi:TonB-dependent receptor domain-containing protein [Ponticaulis profundi]|uniref:TonB-dependent receptor domain-containing protein n=1 Tax=Ponticaulis profundi TaxID=2665222 RepID=A0ABW1S767_9PROT
MEAKSHLKYLLTSCATVAIAPFLLATPAFSQTADEPEVIEQQTEDELATLDQVVVTGSRIKRSVASTPAPVTTIGEQTFEDRGYVSAADALNDMTALIPQLNQAAGDGSDSGDGQQYADIFGLGAGRTLTLVNGRRFVTTSSGMGDAQVDANIIPTGLIDRVEIVQAGGAAVYGSDAIAGVVNYILKDDYEGVELDLQYGNNEQGNYETTSYRLTAGTNFDNGRGNIAVNVEGSESPMLRFSDFDASNRSRITTGNPDDTGPDDGLPSRIEVIPAYFWPFNGNGVIWNTPAPPPNFLTRIDGSPVQFASDGSLVSYDPGTILGIPFAQGGQGTRYSDLAGLRTGVERVTANLIGHYDLTPRIRAKGEVLYSESTSERLSQGASRTVLNQTDPALGAISFFANNPFLPAETVAALSAANPGFGAGAPLWLSRHFYDDLLPANETTNETKSLRLLGGFEGDFDAANRNFYWDVSVSYAKVDGKESSWGVYTDRFNAAVRAVADASGNPVCAINADSDPTNDDPACAPLNPFGAGNISAAAAEYVTVPTGLDYENEQIDFLATIGTSLFELPAGPVDAVFAYEHRREEASYTPFEANRLGLVGTGTQQVATSGDYNTNEFSAEFLVPVINENMDIPGVQALELNGTFRYVDNSIAGEEDVWSVGGRWDVTDGVTIRATKSRNFRAPTLDQLFAPTVVSLSNGGIDPCDADRIDAGPNPAIRRANCEAEWAANPQYGDLAGFQNPAENFTVTEITSGGNADLANEVSDTTTYGIVFDSFLVPGLTVSIDRIEIDLEDGLSAFTNGDFMAACYDSEGLNDAVCSAFTRLQAADGSNPAGTTATGRSTTFNAGLIEFRGEVYYANYIFELEDIWETVPGQISLGAEATHMSDYNVSVTGTTFTSPDNTVSQPDWTARFDAAYTNGPLRLTYQLSYLDNVLAEEGANIENSPNPVIDSNITQDVSASYAFENGLTLRGGVINIADKEPSYPTLSYGDILGRRYFVGVNYSF